MNHYVPISEWAWNEDYSYQRPLTCINHTGMDYGTKNPYARNVHLYKIDPTVLAQGKRECDCSFFDLAVVVPERFPNVRGDDELDAAQCAAIREEMK